MTIRGTLLVVCLLTMNALAQNTVNSKGNRTVNVNNNSGTINSFSLIHVSPHAKQSVRARLAAEASKQLGDSTAWGGLLIPGHEAAPTSNCSVGMGDLLMFGGGFTAVCTKATCGLIGTRNGSGKPMQSSDDVQEIISLHRKKDKVFVEANIYAPDGQIAAMIHDNKIYLDKSRIFFWDHSDESTLELVRKNDGARVFSLKYVNPSTLEVEGRLYNRVRQSIDLSSKQTTLPGVTIDNNCVRDAGLFAFVF